MRVQRREPVDVLVRDGETAVLLPGGIVRLSELSAVLYDLAREQVEVESLARDLEERFGAPAERTSVQATRDAVRDMVEAGLLTEV